MGKVAADDVFFVHFWLIVRAFLEPGGDFGLILGPFCHDFGSLEGGFWE